MTQEKWAGDGLNQDDLAIPEIKLIQASGGSIAKAAGADPGQFYSELTDEIFASFELVVASMQKSRTYWGRSEIGEEPPECSSNDMVEGFLGQCADCEFRNDAPWLLKAEERRVMCLATYNVMGVNITNGLPVLIRCGGLSSGAAKQLYTQLTLHPQVAGAWYRAKTVVSSVPRKTPYGDSFAIKFGALQLLPEDQQPSLAIRTNQLIGRQVEVLTEGEPMEKQTITSADVGKDVLAEPEEPYASALAAVAKADKVLEDNPPPREVGPGIVPLKEALASGPDVVKAALDNVKAKAVAEKIDTDF